MATTSTLERLLDDRRLRPLLPLLHSAWADGYLSRSEIDRLCRALAEAVPDECTDILNGWLDPDSPPSAQEVARLAAAIRADAPKELWRIGSVKLGLRLAGSIDDAVAEVLRRTDDEFGPFPSRVATPVTPAVDEGALSPLPEPGPAEFDLERLRRLLDGPEAQVKARVRAILSRPDFAHRYDEPIGSQRRRVLEMMAILGSEGIGSIGFPPEVGGAGNPSGAVAAFTVIAQHDLSLLTKFGVQFGLFAGALFRLGTDQHRPLLVGALRMDPLGCFAMTETGHGSDVASLETVARHTPSGFEIHTPHPRARKDYIGNAAEHGTVAVVFARLVVGDLDHGVHAFVVSIRQGDGSPSRGVTIGDNGPKAGLDGVDNGRLTFDHVAVSRDALLDRFATVSDTGDYESAITSPDRRFFTTLGTLVGGRVSVAAAAVAVAEAALAIAIRYATRRRQFPGGDGFDRPLVDYRAHQVRLMPRLAATYAYHFAAAEMADEWAVMEADGDDSDHDRRAFEGRAAGLKAYATWHALDTVAECRQACGGQGYLAENRLGVMAADIDVFTTYEGDNTVLAQLLAKALLTDYRSGFEDLTPGRLVRLLTDRIGGIVTGSVPVVGSVGGDRTDPDTCQTLLERRSRYLIERLASRVKGRIDDGMDPGSALLDVQPHALAAARAATELEVFEAMRRVEAEGDLSRVLDDVSALFGLWRIESDLAGYVVSGLLTSNGAKEVRDGVVALSARLAPHARHLVDAFGIPDELLAAPIAL